MFNVVPVPSLHDKTPETYLLRSGCTVAQLWPLLERNKEALGDVRLTEAVKQALWCCLLQRLTDVHVYPDSHPSLREERCGRRASLAAKIESSVLCTCMALLFEMWDVKCANHYLNVWYLHGIGRKVAGPKEGLNARTMRQTPDLL